MSWRGSRRRLGAAALASVALHAAILALLLRAPAPDLAPRREEIPVELVPAPPAREPAAPAIPAPGPPAVSRGGAPAPPQPGSARPPRGRPGETGVRPGAGARSPEPGELDAWFDAQGLAGSGRREREGRRLSVAPPKELLDEAERAGELDRNPGARAKARVDDMIAEMKARDLARYPDASWIELRDGLADGFAPGLEALGERGGFGGAMAGAAKGYLDTAQRFGDRGSPLGDEASAPGKVAADKAAVAHVSAEGDADREALQAGVDRLAASAPPGAGGDPWTSGLVTVVEVEQDATGTVTRVRLVRGSGNAAYDRLAISNARRLVGRSLAPRLAGSRTEWAFATEILVSPPAPAVGIGFDANFKPTGINRPLARSTRTRIELLSLRRPPGRG